MSLSQTDRESLLTWLTDGNTLADWIRGPGSHMARCTVYAKVARDPELTEAFKISRQVGADAERVRGETFGVEPELAEGGVLFRFGGEQPADEGGDVEW